MFAPLKPDVIAAGSVYEDVTSLPLYPEPNVWLAGSYPDANA